MGGSERSGGAGSKPARALGKAVVGPLLATAAHLRGRAATVLDETGMAQKGGAVLSSIHIANDAAAIKSLKVPACSADLILAVSSSVSDCPGASTR